MTMFGPAPLCNRRLIQVITYIYMQDRINERFSAGTRQLQLSRCPVFSKSIPVYGSGSGAFFVSKLSTIRFLSLSSRCYVVANEGSSGSRTAFRAFVHSARLEKLSWMIFWLSWAAFNVQGVHDGDFGLRLAFCNISTFWGFFLSKNHLAADLRLVPLVCEEICLQLVSKQRV